MTVLRREGRSLISRVEKALADLRKRPVSPPLVPWPQIGLPPSSPLSLTRADLGRRSCLFDSLSRAGNKFAGEPGERVTSDMGLERVALPPGSPNRPHVLNRVLNTVPN